MSKMLLVLWREEGGERREERGGRREMGGGRSVGIPILKKLIRTNFQL